MKRTLVGFFLLVGCFSSVNAARTSSVSSSSGSGGGGTGYVGIRDEGSNLVARSTINFIGSAVTCVDNSGTLVTDCTITGGSATPGGALGNVQFYGAGNVLAGQAGFNFDPVTSSMSVNSIDIGGSGTPHLKFDSTQTDATLDFMDSGSPGWVFNWKDFGGTANLQQILSANQYGLYLTSGTSGAQLNARYTVDRQLGKHSFNDISGNALATFDVGAASFTVPITASFINAVTSATVSGPMRVGTILNVGSTLNIGSGIYTQTAVNLSFSGGTALLSNVGSAANSSLALSPNISAGSSVFIWGGNGARVYIASFTPNAIYLSTAVILPLLPSLSSLATDSNGQIIAGTGGGGGAATIIVGTGTVSSFLVQVTSPTQTFNFAGTNFRVIGTGTTAYIVLGDSQTFNLSLSVGANGIRTTGLSTANGGFFTNSGTYGVGSGFDTSTLANNYLLMAHSAAGVIPISIVDAESRSSTRASHNVAQFIEQLADDGNAFSGGGFVGALASSNTIHTTWLVMGSGQSNLDGNATDYFVMDVSSFGTTLGHIGINTFGLAAWLNVAGSTSTPAMLISGQYSSVESSVTFSAPVSTVNWNTGNVQYLQLSANTNLNFINPVAGSRYLLILRQTGAGAFTVGFPATVKWSGGTTPTLTTTTNKSDVITFIYDGNTAQYYGGSSLNY